MDECVGEGIFSVEDIVSFNKHEPQSKWITLEYKKQKSADIHIETKFVQ